MSNHMVLFREKINVTFLPDRMNLIQLEILENYHVWNLSNESEL